MFALMCILFSLLCQQADFDNKYIPIPQLVAKAKQDDLDIVALIKAQFSVVEVAV